MRWLWGGLALLVLIGGGIGFVHLRAQINTYDQRYADCMEVKKSWLPGYTFAYPSREFTEAVNDCEHQAA